MNIGTQFDYNNYILIYNHPYKNPHEKAPNRVHTELNSLIQLFQNVVANFC